MTSRKMGLKSISRVCFRSFCEVEFRNVEGLKVAREIIQNISSLVLFSDFPFGIRFSIVSPLFLILCFQKLEGRRLFYIVI